VEGTGRLGGGETGTLAGRCADVLKSFEEVLLGFTNGEGGGAVAGRSVVGAEGCRGGGRRPRAEFSTGNGFCGGEVGGWAWVCPLKGKSGSSVTRR